VPTRPLTDRNQKKIGSTAIFECKQALCDLRRDNCHSEATRQRLEAIWECRQTLETCLRVHYPNSRITDSLFTEFNSHHFTATGNWGYARILRELNTLQNRLYGGTKFREIDSLPLREFVFFHAAQRVIPRFGNPDRMRGSCGIEWRARAHAQTDLA